MKASIITIVTLVILLIVVGGYLFFGSSNSDNGKVVCTKEAKQCQDGSYVSRVAPNCEFADCPKEKTNNQINITKQNQTQSPTQKTYNIEISDFAFKQSQLTINVGDTIIWTNKDSTRHTVTSDAGNELGSDYLPKNEIYSHTFNLAGTFDYHCRPHPYMKGKIIVR